MSFCKLCGSEMTVGSGSCQSCGARSSVAVESAAAPVSAASVASFSVLATNVAATLAYLAGFITGIIFLVLDPYRSNSVVRFHAYQSIFFNVAWFFFWIVWIILSAVSRQGRLESSAWVLSRSSLWLASESRPSSCIRPTSKNSSSCRSLVDSPRSVPESGGDVAVGKQISQQERLLRKVELQMYWH